MNYPKQNIAEQDPLSKDLFLLEVCNLIGLEVSATLVEKSLLWYLKRLKPSTRVQIVSDFLSYQSALLETGENNE